MATKRQDRVRGCTSRTKAIQDGLSKAKRVYISRTVRPVKSFLAVNQLVDCFEQVNHPEHQECNGASKSDCSILALGRKK
jgi:hypothetical protein